MISTLGNVDKFEKDGWYLEEAYRLEACLGNGKTFDRTRP